LSIGVIKFHACIEIGDDLLVSEEFQSAGKLRFINGRVKRVAMEGHAILEPYELKKKEKEVREVRRRERRRERGEGDEEKGEEKRKR